jgi:adenylate cyclase
VVAWIHGCIGVYLWLRLKRQFSRAMPLLLCAATILPLLALLGFFQAGRVAPALARDPAWRQANLAGWQVGTPVQNATLKTYRNWTLAAGAGLFGLVVLARGVRSWRERHGGSISISYPNGRSVRMPRGFSVLEASRAARVAHASICGGRGRCSTCRIHVIAGRVPVPPPSPGEQAVLRRVSAGPSARLACQLRPAGDIAVVPLLPPHRTVVGHSRGDQPRPGEERFVVAMVIDMRNSVRLAETRMAFDAVFIIDRFIAALDTAVAQAGGRASNFTGDGLVAAFGLACPPGQACRQAFAALVQVGRNVAALNQALLGEMPEPILFGVGIHGSTAVVGEIG